MDDGASASAFESICGAYMVSRQIAWEGIESFWVLMVGHREDEGQEGENGYGDSKSWLDWAAFGIE